MTDAVKIALIGALGTAASGGLSVLIIVLLRRLEVKVDGRLTELLKANKRADTMADAMRARIKVIEGKLRDSEQK